MGRKSEGKVNIMEGETEEEKEKENRGKETDDRRDTKKDH